jgi:hypothetical protein
LTAAQVAHQLEVLYSAGLGWWRFATNLYSLIRPALDGNGVEASAGIGRYGQIDQAGVGIAGDRIHRLTIEKELKTLG